MTSLIFRSLILFSFSLAYLSADDFEEEALSQEEEIAFEELSDPQLAASPTTAEEPALEKQEPAKKIKPHYAGVRRTYVSETPEKNGKVKNKWFFSKTQPKVSKKETSENLLPELPEDRPYYVNASYQPPSLIAAAENTPGNPGCGWEQVSVDPYPRTGFAAPRGHIILSAEWLYWRTRQEGMEFATSEQIRFDFQSGFRVGLGAHLPSFDGWCIGANYTRFTPEGSHSSHGSFYPLFLFQGGGPTGAAVAEAHGSWKIDFQNLDVAFGKSYYLSKTLVFSPFFGFRGAWIDQKAHFSYAGGYIPPGQVFRTHFKNDFKGAGPLAGTEMNWQLGAGFSFFGDLAAAAIVGQFDTLQTQNQLDGGEVVHLDTHTNLISPTLQMVAGVAWDRNFYRDAMHFGLSAGFETQYWWKQNQTEQFTAGTLPTYVRQRGDLSFYGLTLKARFDF